MKVRRYEAVDLGTAMALVRQSLGEDALILETRQIESGFEVLAAIDARGDTVAPLELANISDEYLDERRAALAWHGVSPDLIARLTDKELARDLGRRLRFAAIEPVATDRPLLFVGEPGSGKTLSLVKIATRLVMDGVKPHLVSTDGQKAGAAEQLAALTRILGLTLVVADQPATLRRAVEMRTGDVPTLIDGRGMIPGSTEDESVLRSLIASVDAEPILVLPAGLDAAESVDISAHFARLGARRLIATRLDVARRIGGVVEAAWRSRLVLAEYGLSGDVVDGLAPLTSNVLADRLTLTPLSQVKQSKQTIFARK